MKANILILTIILIVSFSSPLRADSSELYPKPFVNSVLYGTAVGFILGLVLYRGSMATYRITSYGLYGGIILGLYVVHNDKELEAREPAAQLFENRPQLNFTFHY